MADRLQRIEFCKSRDGTRIAFATCGEGTPVVWVGHFSRHLEYDWESPVWRPWLDLLTTGHRLIRYDLRGCGLSDRKGVKFSLDRLSEDFDAVIGAARLDKFAFVGMAGNVGCGVSYAVRFPARVTHLVLYGCHTRGPLVRGISEVQKVEAETRLKAIELGWSNQNAAFGQFFTALHAPDAPLDYVRSYNELLRTTTSPENATALIRAYWHSDLVKVAPQVRAPTMIVHARHDSIVPFEEGRLAATLIPGAHLVPLESRSHVLVDTEPSWNQFAAALEVFLPRQHTSMQFDVLTAREREVLELVVQGRRNNDIAKILKISDKTVRNHVSIILGKLQLQGRSQLIARARDAGFARMRF